MTKKGKGIGKGSKPSLLTEDDHELWQHTARTLDPLKVQKPRVHDAAALDPERREERLRTAEADPRPHRAGLAKPGSPPIVPVAGTPPPSKRKTPLDLAVFDHKHARKLRRGHVEIEGRIDLHGMRQGEAHAALSRFIIASAAQGKRWVLVITGKGAPSRRPGDDESRQPFDEPQRGILKRYVPHWLAEPDLRHLIVSFTEAAVGHGGSGALYVHLRRHRGDD